jgi:hypothetical protein
MRKLVVVVVLAVAFMRPAPASAEVGIGAFLGEPTGLDLFLGLKRRSALDIVFGWYSNWDNRDYIDEGAYAHVTYLVTPVVAHGNSINVPLRVGIGGAVFDDAGRFNDHLHVAVRVPFEVALKFRRTPLEIYGEIAIKATVIDPDDTHRFIDLDGGIGLRFYF